MICTGIIIIIRQNLYIRGLDKIDLKIPVIGHFSPLVVCQSLFLFAGFSNLQINWNLGKLAKESFYIYLFHAGVLTTILKIQKAYFSDIFLNPIWYIPVISILILFCSSLLSKIYLKICNSKLLTKNK